MSLTITNVMYGPTPVDWSSGEVVAFSFLVVCQPPGKYKKVQGVVRVYDESAQNYVRTMAQDFPPDGTGNYPCHLVWDGKDDHGARLRDGDYGPVFEAHAKKEEEEEQHASVVSCSGISATSPPRPTPVKETDDDCLALTCSPVQDCRFDPKGCPSGKCAPDSSGGNESGAGSFSLSDSLLLLPPLGPESLSPPPIILPALGPMSFSLPPIILSALGPESFSPPPWILPAAISPLYFQPPTLSTPTR